MIPTESFGRTGHQSTRVIFGAAAFSAVTQAEADRTMELLLRFGINHIDTAASYGDSELRLGPWMERHRADVFLATKTGERTSQAAYDQIRRSLERLRVDQVDLIQLHNLVDPAEWETALGPGGALEAAIRAREEGLVRFIGVTGHGAQIAATHRRSLSRFDFDSVLLPYNYLTYGSRYYAENFDALLATARERNVAVQTIKSIAYRPWSGRDRGPATTWYQPLERPDDVARAVHWALGRERSAARASS
jgi:aryl-alcohol dehydrogenase-like predicted oxidoreductase